MSQVRTDWRSRNGEAATVIVESHMVKPANSAFFVRPRLSIINLGIREAGVFLLANGTITADVPIALAVMTKATADAIAKTVLPASYVKDHGGIELVRRCPCQYGICGHCAAGDHTKCTIRVGFDGKPPVFEHTHLIGSTGNTLDAVNLTGIPCRATCPCTTCAAKSSPPKAVAYRRAGKDLRTGDTVWLTAKTLGAPAVCWKQPRATVVRIEHPYVFVQVDGDGEHRIHIDNLLRDDPRGAVPRRPRAPRAPAPLPDGYESKTLF
jgi:Family of unknown function (DUF6248)